MKKLALSEFWALGREAIAARSSSRSRQKLAAEARLVISDVFDAGILDIAREFGVPNAYLPPGKFRTRLEPAVEMELVKMLRGRGRGAGGARGFHARAEGAHADRVSPPHHQYCIRRSCRKFPGMEAWKQALDAGEKIDRMHRPLRRCRNRQRRDHRATKSPGPA